MKTKSFSGRAVKRAPQRTCVSCRKVGDKRGLLRLVRTGDGVVELDVTGKKAGRGAYLCPAERCWESGIAGGRLEHALRVTLENDRREDLIRLGRSLCKENISG